jgi:SAM-dependent methyltransferase
MPEVPVPGRRRRRHPPSETRLHTADFYDRTYYDGHGKSNYNPYDIDSSPFAFQADVIEKLLAHYGLDGPVLDVGCAKGYLVYVLRLRGVEAYGLDWSQYALDHAYPDARPYLQRADATRLPFAGRRFALVTSFDVLEHMDDRAVKRAFRECARVSDRQLHQVNTGRLPEWAYEGDESHCVKYPLEHWQRIVDRLRLDATTVCEPDRQLPFLIQAAPQG